MTPKEKATEIIEKHYQKIIDIVDVNNAFHYSKECALVTIDEILEALNLINEKYNKFSLEFYEKVKNDILET